MCRSIRTQIFLLIFFYVIRNYLYGVSRRDSFAVRTATPRSRILETDVGHLISHPEVIIGSTCNLEQILCTCFRAISLNLGVLSPPYLTEVPRE